MKKTKPGRTIESEARTQATPQQAWESFAKPERLLDWWAETVEGASFRTAVIWQTQSGPPRSIARIRSRPGWASALWVLTRSGIACFAISTSHEM